MRFALMIEPQQGLLLRRPAGGRPARRGGRLRDALPLRSLRQLPRRGRPPHHRRLGRPGRARPRDERASGSASLVSPVTFRHPGNLAKIDRDRATRCRGGRLEVGLGAGWNEGEHRTTASRSRRSSVRAEMLEEQLEILRGLWEGPDGWSFSGRHYQVPGGRSSGRGRSSARRRRSSSAARGARARCGSRSASPTSSTCRPRRPSAAAERFAELDDGVRATPGATRRTLRHSAMVGVLVGRDAAEVERRSRAAPGRLRDGRGRGRPGSTSDGPAGSTARRTRRARWRRGSRRPAASGSCSRTSSPGTSSMIDLLGEVLVRG